MIGFTAAIGGEFRMILGGLDTTGESREHVPWPVPPLALGDTTA
jgi:hypothetical protein